jgi:hypothetical protein
MDAASWKGKRDHPLTKRIVLICLIAAVAVGLLAFAILVLVGLNCPHAWHLTWFGERPTWITKILERPAQSDSVGATVACAYVTVWSTTMRIRGKTALSY